MSNAVSEELVEKARDAYDDAAGSMTEWCEIEYMRAALTAIAPRLRAEGMREAATELYRAFRSSERFRDAPANLKLHDLLVETVDALNARADALDPPKETKP